MRNLDFSSWQAVITTLLGLVVFAIMMVGIRLLVMERVQQRRQRENRQINERLRTLIAAYKTLGGSFTGKLAVDPTHLRELLNPEVTAESAGGGATDSGEGTSASASSDRSRRIRDAVEAALSDVILLGNEEQVRLAARAATDLAAGRPVHTDALVVSLRDFIRKVLDLEPVPTELAIPKQGPTRPGGGGSSGGKGKGGAGGGDRGGAKQGGKGADTGGGGAAGGGRDPGVGGGRPVGDPESGPWRG
jgi:heme exporter protein D